MPGQDGSCKSNLLTLFSSLALNLIIIGAFDKSCLVQT